MDHACFLTENAITATVQWTTREANQEADALANGDTDGFDPRPSCQIIPADIVWIMFWMGLNGEGDVAHWIELLQRLQR